MFISIVTIEGNLNLVPKNVCLLDMLQLKKDINVLNPFQRKCLLSWMLNKDSVFYDFFQTEDLQNDHSPTLIIIQPDNPSFIIPRESGSSVLATENSSLPAMPSHDVHDRTTPNKGEIRKTTTTLIPFDIVYSRQRATKIKGSSDPLHDPESTNLLSNVLINYLPHVQPTSSSSSELASLEHESCSN